MESEYQEYLKIIQRKLLEQFNWKLSINEIDDFLEAKRYADAEFLGG